MKTRWIATFRHGIHAAVTLFAVLAIETSLFGQITVSGRVTSQSDGTPVVYAHVKLERTTRTAITDTAGWFTLQGVKPGPAVLRISFVGYATYEQPFNLTRDTVIRVSLAGEAILGDEVTITATRALEKYPVAHTTVGSKEIRAVNLGRDVPYIILQTPSVNVTSDAGNGIGYTGMTIRGTDLTRINVTVNGIPVNDAESQGVWFVDLPDIASSAGSIQVQRGVGTSTNGAGAFGASVNFHTTDMRADPYGELDVSGGSYNTFKSTLRFGTGLMPGRFSVDGRLSYIRSDGYVDRASSNLASYYLAAGYYGPKTTIRLINFTGTEKTYQAWEGVPKDSLATNRTYNPAGEYTDAAGNIAYYGNQTDNYLQENYQLIFSQVAGRGLTLNGALHYTHGRGYYENYKEDASFSSYGLGDVVLGGDTISSTDLVNRKELDNDFAGLTFSAVWQIPDRLKVIAGGGWNRYHGRHSGKIIWAEFASNGSNTRNWYYNTGLKSDFNLYAKANYHLLPRLNLFADLQYRRVAYDMEGTLDNLRNLDQDHLFNFFNPKTGLYWTLNPRNDLYFSFAVANREPSRNNYKDADPGQEPGPERLYDYELGYNLKLPWSAWGINLYYMDYRDQLVLTGEINDVGEAVMVNVPHSYRAGLEVTASMEFFNKKLAWNLSGTFSRNRIRQFTQYTDQYDADWNFTGQKEEVLNDRVLSFSPSVAAASSITWKPVKGLALSVNSRYTGRQYIDNTTTDSRSLDGYFLNGISAGYTVKTRLVGELGFNLTVNNLFSAEYESNAWIYPFYVNGEYFEANGYFPQAPVNFLAGVSFRL